MDNLKLFTTSELNLVLKKRPKETKLGEHIVLLPNFNDIYEQLLKLDVTYVVFGIKEDIGVFSNYGNAGTSNAWDATKNIFLNTQSNAHTYAKKIAILGSLEFPKYQELLNQLDQNNKKDIAKTRKKVTKIDEAVSYLVSQIVSAGKIPIIIGGGHNNAYGNIKGTSLALKKSINAINFDAHHDFRAEEGRHSGNGFSYAYAEGFLKYYFIFGLHENYTSDTIFKTLERLKAIQYNTFESMMVRGEKCFDAEMEKANEHISSKHFGLEIDCDAIQNVPSSAMTPSGFSVNKARAFVNYFGKQEHVSYLHICEAAPTRETETQVGKLISYLITDFIRAHESI
ncbi:formimidoylglutamase [Psychroserpens burtonensis]|uniref:Formimidoylglutamase n=1 Tax=Psychroserpens burtonensis TaxID=49278 RepID=A0A5C7B7W2_9FLAO|nr:formimidoylglutamase [Psychroserpens burtonensis]TXE17298.1 formimidoylglutamase [Psychroserpens burtonensis]